MLDEPVDQRIRLTDAAKAAEQHDSAVADSRHGFSHRLHDFVDHWEQLLHPLVLAKAGTQSSFLTNLIYSWIPACAGMSGTIFTPPRARASLRQKPASLRGRSGASCPGRRQRRR